MAESIKHFHGKGRTTTFPEVLNDNDDNDSVEASTISTLSSTESVFDRLYRRGIRSQRKYSSNVKKTPFNKIAGGGTKSLSAPITAHRKRNRKDRLGAYCNSTKASDIRSLGYGDKTPRRRNSGLTSIFWCTAWKWWMCAVLDSGMGSFLPGEDLGRRPLIGRPRQQA